MEDGGNSIQFELINEDSMFGTTLGTIAIPLTDAALLNAPDKTITEMREVGDQGALLEFSLCLRGVKLGETQSSAPPLATDEEVEESVDKGIGSASAVRITALKGRGFKVQKRLFRKNVMPSVYCVMKLDSSEDVWRTSTIKRNTSHEWNESKQFPLFYQSETINVRVFGADRGQPKADKSLGSIATTVGELR